MRNIYFFIGTEAELMKMFTTIKEAKKRGYNCYIISNGQNIIDNSEFLRLSDSKIDINLSVYSSKEKKSLGYLKWFIKTEKYATSVLKNLFVDKKNEKNLMVVHGDTLSTLMGSRIARKCKIPYVHVESGARSFHWFSPFPEEIDRYLATKYSVMNFAPKKEYYEYAKKKFKSIAVNTFYNTGIETLYYAIEKNKKEKIPRIIKDKYFVLAIHRQENLLNRVFLEKLFNEIEKISEEMKCLFIYHIQTQLALEKFSIWDKISRNPNIKIVKRLEYCEFIAAITNSEFIIADGCGNQQEMYYLGHPYLIMRSEIERDSEGLGYNAQYFENNFSNISEFVENYKNYKKDMIKPQIMPSKIIMDNIDKLFTEW